MSENIARDAQEIKKRLTLMGHKDVSESTICELLKSFGSNYEVEFAIDMIIGPNNANLFEMQDNLIKPGPSNAASTKAGSMETMMKKDEIDGEASNDSTSDTDDDYYFSTLWEDNSFMDATPQSSPPLLPAIELHGSRPMPDHSNNSTCGTVDIEIFEENNNDPNNNLDVIQILQEQRTYATNAESHNQAQEAESTEHFDSPKPGCSKDVSDPESATLNTKLRDEALQICNLLPRFKYEIVYKALFKNRHTKNRVEVVLWELLPQKRPVPHFLNKRKITDDSCIVECKKSLSKLVDIESQSFTDQSTLSQDNNQSLSTKNVTGEKFNPFLMNSMTTLCSQSSTVKTVSANPTLTSSMQDISSACGSTNPRMSAPQRNAQGGRITVAEHFKSTLNQCLPKGRISHSASQPPNLGLLRPATLIVQNHHTPANRAVTSSSTILAPPKLKYSNAQQHKDEMEVDAPMPFEQRVKSDNNLKVTRSTSVDAAHTSGGRNNVSSDSQSIQNYMRYLQMVQYTKRRNVSGIARPIMTRDDIKNLLYSQRHHSFGNRNTIFSKVKQNAQNVAQPFGKDTNIPHTNRNHNSNGNFPTTNYDAKERRTNSKVCNDKFNRQNISGSILQARLSLLDKNRGTESGRPASSATVNENMPFRKDKPCTSTATDNMKLNDALAYSSNSSLDNALAKSSEGPSASTSTASTADVSEVASTVPAETAADRPFLQGPSTSQAAISLNDSVSEDEFIAAARALDWNEGLKDTDPLPGTSEHDDLVAAEAAADWNDGLKDTDPLSGTSEHDDDVAAATAADWNDGLKDTGPLPGTSEHDDFVAAAAALDWNDGLKDTDPLPGTSEHDDFVAAAVAADWNVGLKDTDPLPLCIALDPGVLQTYKELTAIFPHVDNGYIKQLCQQHASKNGFIDQSELLNSLIDALLANGDAHPSTREIDETPDREEFDKNEQYSTLLEILPDADPMYLKNAVDKMYSEPDAMVEFVQSKLENPNYPTREEALTRKKITEQQTQYTTEFSVERFLEIFPDPFAHFENPKRKCKFSVEAIEFLRSNYDPTEAYTIREEYKGCGYNLALTAQIMEERNPRMDNERSIHLMTTKDIPLLQEIAFIKHRAEIRQYCDKLRARELDEFYEFKRQDLLLECQCCFADDCLPSKCSTCDDGHLFCNSCIVIGTESRLAEGETRVPCFLDCENEFSLYVLQRVLPPTKFSILVRKRQQAEVMAAGLEGLVSCPFCHFASIPPAADKVFKCLNPECMKETCRKCKELNHVPLKCNETKSERARLFLEERMTEALVRKCCRCEKPYFKDDGCNRIACSCGAIMCYICDAEIKGYDHFNGQGSMDTNRCPMWSDNHVINAKAVLKVAEETMKDIKEKDPDVELNAQGLLPSVPNEGNGPHEQVPNANAIPERVNRRIRYST